MTHIIRKNAGKRIKKTLIKILIFFSIKKSWIYFCLFFKSQVFSCWMPSRRVYKTSCIISSYETIVMQRIVLYAWKKYWHFWCGRIFVLMKTFVLTRENCGHPDLRYLKCQGFVWQLAMTWLIEVIDRSVCQSEQTIDCSPTKNMKKRRDFLCVPARAESIP